MSSSYTQLVSLEQMENTVRRMTARYTEESMTTSQIDYYINLAYTIHFPEQFKNLKLTKPLVFYTVPNVDTYDFVYEDHPTNPQTGQQSSATPGNFQITPPVYCQGYILRYFQDKTTFYNRWPNLSVNQIINSGTGIPDKVYSGIIPSRPFYRAQLDIFGNVTEAMVIISSYDHTGFNIVITDIPQPNSNVGDLVDSQGNVVGDSTIPGQGVNYLTGKYGFTLANSAVIPKGDHIYAAVVPYQASRPVDVLFYNQQIIFRPCPKQVYQVEFQISMQPTQLIEEGSAPELDEWYLLICCLASKLIYTNFPDPEGMAQLMPILDDEVCKAQRRTLRQLGSQRAATIFSQPGRPLATWFMGTEYSGISG